MNAGVTPDQPHYGGLLFTRTDRYGDRLTITRRGAPGDDRSLYHPEIRRGDDGRELDVELTSDDLRRLRDAINAELRDVTP